MGEASPTQGCLINHPVPSRCPKGPAGSVEYVPALVALMRDVETFEPRPSIGCSWTLIAM